MHSSDITGFKKSHEEISRLKAVLKLEIRVQENRS